MTPQPPATESDHDWRTAPLRVTTASRWVAAIAGAALLWATMVGAIVGIFDAFGPLELVGSSAPGPGAGPTQATEAVFGGLGAWVDVYDYATPYLAQGADAAVTPDDVADMAAGGVDTLYLQTSGTSSAGDPLVADPQALLRFIDQAHAHGLDVVGWYAPRLTDTDDDLRRIEAALAAEGPSGGLDGFALDMEVVAVEDAELRGRRLVELSERLRSATGAQRPLGAIVLPPVLLSEISPDLWPRFPWTALADVYDAWLPMAYWTQRSPNSAYRDPARNLESNVGRLRSLLGDPDAVIHAVGGIGDALTVPEAARFSIAARELAVGGASFYDHATTTPEAVAVLDAAVGGQHSADVSAPDRLTDGGP